jgi:hypothetical protein
MPNASTTRCRRKLPALTGLVLTLAAGLAAAATGTNTRPCKADDCKPVTDTLSTEHRVPALSSTVPLTTLRDTTVLRDDDGSGIDPSKGDTASAVAQLLERRDLQRAAEQDDEAAESQGRLPGLNPEVLRLFRGRMYRTDI